MHSCFYEGRLRHRRFSPRDHVFEYRLFMVYADLAELDALFDSHPLWSVGRPNVATFSREDHLGPQSEPLETSVRNLVEEKTGRRPDGPIRLLTHFKYLGYGFNPVSFYYCFDASERLETIVGEVNNTPWGEQHPYVLTQDMNKGTAEKPRYEFGKSFHVSPFMPMQQDYLWAFTAPGQALSVQMENFEHGSRCFDATLTLRRTEITRQTMSRILLSYPAMTARVMASIYWQALRLWGKRIPVFSHPDLEPGKA